MNFYEVSKVLGKRTDAHNRVQFLVRLRGYGRMYDSWVDAKDTNESLKQVFRNRHQLLFSRLPSAPNLLRATKFSVPIHELDTIMPAGWSFNTFKTSTTCRLQPDKPVELTLLERRKVFYDHSRCLLCQGGNGAPVACKDVARRIVYGSSLLKVSFYRERNKEAQRKPKERTRLTCRTKPRDVNKVDFSSVTYRWVGPVKNKTK